jgi:hypothetical protein
MVILSLWPTTVCRRIDPTPKFWTHTSRLPSVEQKGRTYRPIGDGPWSLTEPKTVVRRLSEIARNNEMGTEALSEDLNGRRQQKGITNRVDH